nr:aldo/keto reductase [Evansella caseinilytica]
METTHLLFQQAEAMEIMKEFVVQTQAWGPFSEGKCDIFKEKTLSTIAKKYGKTTAQVMLRWNIQRGVIVIPKSVHKERTEENFKI